jgi:phosphopantetheinyl transferase
MTVRAALIEIPFDEGEPRPARVRRQSEYARLALGECAIRTGAPSAGWSQADDGRPLPNAGWHWSLSHSRGMAAAAVARSPIGVDIEHIRPRRAELFDKVAMPQEWDLLGGRDWAAFFTLWTAKEATLKAVGRGVGWLNECRVLSAAGGSLLVHFDGRDWPVRHYRAGEYACALACSAATVSWQVLQNQGATRAARPSRLLVHSA